MAAAAATITCPKCKKTFKGRVELEGKRVRCPRCDNPFQVKMNDTLKVDRGSAAAAGKPAAPAGPHWSDEPLPVDPVAPAAAAAPPPRPAVDPDDEDDYGGGPNPYDVTAVDLRARCPNCANAMVDEDAIICLHCGYNTQTRSLGSTKKTVETTQSDVFSWLLPGLLALGGMVIITIASLFYCVLLPEMVKGAFYVHESVRWWIVVFALFGMWPLGRFAMNRLVLNPIPPEEEKN
jgi:Zn finger protein HypA/HybF involved in hydrogenase expression